MTVKRFTFEIKTQGNKAYTQWYDNGKPINSAETLCELLNELHEENQSIKKHIRELYKYVKFDVDNEIEVYPKELLGCIVDILKIIGDVE